MILFWPSTFAHTDIYSWQDAATCWLPLEAWEKYPYSKYPFNACLYFNGCNVKGHKINSGKTMSMINKVIFWLTTLWDSLAWRRWRLLLTQWLLGGFHVAQATSCRFGRRFGASFWVITVLYVSHSFDITATAHPSTRDLSSFGLSMTQSSCPVAQGDLDYANKCFVKNFKIQDNTVSLLAFPSISQYDCEDVQQLLKKGDMIVTTCEKLCKCDNKDSRCSNIKKNKTYTEKL